MTSYPQHPHLRLPKSAGTYLLLLHLGQARAIQIGKLGRFDFPAGYYTYIGSASGPGGLAGRLGRHLASVESGSATHWHIDYLRRLAPIVEIWLAEHPVRREHDWAAIMAGLPGCTVPAPRFGASDCRCHSHLFHFPQPPAVTRFSASLGRPSTDDGPLQVVQVNRENEPA